MLKGQLHSMDIQGSFTDERTFEQKYKGKRNRKEKNTNEFLVFDFER